MVVLSLPGKFPTLSVLSRLCFEGQSQVHCSVIFSNPIYTARYSEVCLYSVYSIYPSKANIFNRYDVLSVRLFNYDDMFTNDVLVRIILSSSNLAQSRKRRNYLFIIRMSYFNMNIFYYIWILETTILRTTRTNDICWNSFVCLS